VVLLWVTALGCGRDVFLALTGPPLQSLWLSRLEGGGGGGSDKGLPPLLLVGCCGAG